MANVLLAEPDRWIRQFVAGILGDSGHRVEACGGGEEACGRLGLGTVDVVVSDLVLSGGGEGAVFGRSCAALGIPTITLSGCEYRAGRGPAKRPPALVEKPFRFADLQRVLDAVERRSRLPSPEDDASRLAARLEPAG
ncbi:MAG: hypothetical protein ACREE2_03165 [Stellaceae bacterium]